MTCDRDRPAPEHELLRLARAAQAELARCDDPNRRFFLLRRRNELLAELQALRRSAEDA